VNKPNKQVIIILVQLVILSFVIPIDTELVKSNPVTIYSTQGWPTATPEEVGMSSTRLEQMYQHIIDHEELGVDSVSILKNGFLCYDKYFDYYNYSNIHNMFSVTKSFTSTLIGIANYSGMITNLDESVLEIFSNRTIENLDSRKEAMTIRHLLEMRSGLEWNELDEPVYREGKEISYNNYTFHTNVTDAYPGTWLGHFNPVNDFPRQLNSTDWIQYVLDKPMVAEPGTEWYYNTGVSHLLSAIFTEKTGKSLEAFAKEHLFDPMNFSDYTWWKDPYDPSELNVGGGGLWLQPEDMLKYGYLYLNNGTWNNSQIIPELWIYESTKDYSPALGNLGYGYQWWIDTAKDYYFALGHRGQIILVQPENDLVVVITACGNEDTILASIVNVFIFSALLPKDTSTSTTTTTTTTPTPGWYVPLLLFTLVSMIFVKRSR
jgi:CubicO group peptidase (beta-lactamase class C family)